jgi:SAM-dependent methyltransferase
MASNHQFSKAGHADWLDRVKDAVGLEPTIDQPIDLIDEITSRHGAEGAAFAKLSIGDGDAREELFQAKNATLSLSIDTSLSWSGNLYRGELRQLEAVAERLKPTKVIDAGCEQGLITCFVAALLPNSKVVGFDRCPQAIACARDLAQLLGISNTEFIVCDLFDADLMATVNGPAELVFSSRAILGEAVNGSAETPPELLSGTVEPTVDWSVGCARAASALSQLAESGGTLISVERASTTGLVRWARSLCDAGFSVNAPRCSLICVEESGLPEQTFALIEARKNSSVEPLETSSLLAGVTGLGEDGERVWDGASAEAVALNADLVDVVAVGRWQAAGEPQAIEHIEAWTTADGGLLEFRSSTTGARRTKVHAASAAAEITQRLRSEIQSHFEGVPPVCEPLLGQRSASHV